MSVSSAQPAMSQGKIDNYRSERGARAYHADHQGKLHRRWSDRRERRILERYLGMVGPTGLLLDVPCGYGRFLPLFSDHATEVVEADFSGSMLALNRSLHPDLAIERLECSALDLPVRDRSFDTVVSIRLSHHLDREADRERHVRELCRVTRDAVILTFFSSASFKNRLRQVRSMWNSKRPKNTLAPARVKQVLADCGFDVAATASLSWFGSGHVYVLARRSVQ